MTKSQYDNEYKIKNNYNQYTKTIFYMIKINNK